MLLFLLIGGKYSKLIKQSRNLVQYYIYIRTKRKIYFLIFLKFVSCCSFSMGSCILRFRNVGPLTSYFFQFNGSYGYGNFQRTIHTKCILFSNITKHFLIHDLRDSAQATKDSDFGKVVDLGYDFDQLKVDDEEIESVKFKSNKGFVKKNKMWRGMRKPKKTIEEEHTPVYENENELEPDETENLSMNNEVKKQNFKLTTNKIQEFRRILTLIKSKKFRNKEGKILLEGKRLIHDAISAGLKPLNVFFSRFEDLRTLNLPENIKVTQMPYRTLSLWSEVVTSQGVIGIFQMPELCKSQTHYDTVPLKVICDNIKDPGNLGSILRITAAVGCEELILTSGCVDIWEPKVLRAAAGAHFRLSVVNKLTWQDIENKIPEGIQVVLADNKTPADSFEASKENEDKEKSQTNNFFRNSDKKGSSLPLSCYTLFKYKLDGAVIVLGGETSGLSDEAYQFAISRKGRRVYLPMCNGTESLNSAISLGVLSYEFKRQISCINCDESLKETISISDSEADR